MILDQSITKLDSNSSLIIDTRPWLDRQVLLTSWTVGVGFYSKDNNSWLVEDIDPGITLITDEHLTKQGLPIYSYLQQIPNEIIEALKPYEYRQFTLLKFLSIFPSLQDIFLHSPVLFWLTIIESLKNKWPVNKTVDLLHMKRVDIVKALFSIRSNQSPQKCVRFINKIKLFDANQVEYKLIRDFIDNYQLIDLFSHWKSISVQALVVVSHYPKLMSTPLVENLLDNTQSLVEQKVLFSRLARILDDIENMAEMMEVNLPNTLYRSLRTKDDLNTAHDDLIVRFNLSDTVAKKGTVKFPDCPLGDTLGNNGELVQIKNSISLSHEGREMHHCVGGYVKQAERGECYFYSVLAPERGTIQIAMENEHFSILQFRLACNEEPSEESWFQARQAILGG